MLASESVKVGDTVICMIDEWRKGSKECFDCSVLIKENKGVEVLYLSGYRSRNDFVEWDDVIAKVDMSQPLIHVGAFEGHFLPFESVSVQQSSTEQMNKEVL